MRNAACRRMSAVSSDVATTTSARESPSSPRSSSRNSFTSRPRSPTSPMTETSQAAWRASIDIKTDFPTPDPAKIPSRWPSQQVVKQSTTRTPVAKGAPTRRRKCAAGGAERKGQTIGPCGNGPLPSIGSPSALMTRPSHDGCGARLATSVAMRANSPGLTASNGLNGMAQAKPS